MLTWSGICPKLHFLINRYTDEASTESETGQLWRTVIQRYLWRILLYSIVLIAIVILSKQWLLPIFVDTMPRWGRLVGALITLVIMSPFLFALSYPASKKPSGNACVRPTPASMCRCVL